MTTIALCIYVCICLTRVFSAPYEGKEGIGQSAMLMRKEGTAPPPPFPPSSKPTVFSNQASTTARGGGKGKKCEQPGGLGMIRSCFPKSWNFDLNYVFLKICASFVFASRKTKKQFKLVLVQESRHRWPPVGNELVWPWVGSVATGNNFMPNYFAIISENFPGFK